MKDDPDGCKPPLLSIAIPTLNRRQLLETTIQHLLHQLRDVAEPVEFIVSDNASEDGTASLFSTDGPYAGAVRYVHHKERVNIDESFARTVALCRGKFVVLFGDDDIPLPGFVKEVAECAASYPDAGLIYINRIIGDMDLNRTTEVPHCDSPFGRQLMPIGSFIEKFTHWPGFVSCLAFSAGSWERGQHAVKQKYPGFDFLSKVYWGCQGLDVCYIAAPLVLQRRGIQAWKQEWPRYWLLSMPSLLVAMDEAKISRNALASWIAHETSNKRFIIDCIVAKAYRYSITDPFWKQSRSFQTSPLRKLFSLGVQYLLPGFLAEAAYKKSKKKT